MKQLGISRGKPCVCNRSTPCTNWPFPLPRQVILRKISALLAFRVKSLIHKFNCLFGLFQKARLGAMEAMSVFAPVQPPLRSRFASRTFAQLLLNPSLFPSPSHASSLNCSFTLLVFVNLCEARIALCSYPRSVWIHQVSQAQRQGFPCRTWPLRALAAVPYLSSDETKDNVLGSLTAPWFLKLYLLPWTTPKLGLWGHVKLATAATQSLDERLDCIGTT
jgi:hypothetical protein